MKKILEELGVIVASVAVIITFIGVILSDKRTRESNELTRTELNIRLRPWIKIGDTNPTYVTFQNGEIMKWEEYTNKINELKETPNFIRMITEIKNVGQSPTLKLNTIKHQANSKFLKNILYEKQFEAESIFLLPEDHIFYTYHIPYEDWINASYKNTPYYFGIRIDYHIDEKTITSLGRIWVIRAGASTIEETWID